MKIAKAIGLLAVAAVVVACGGGGDEAGDSVGVSEMSVVPDDFTWEVGSCGGALSTGEVVHIINGGQPPFRILNSRPDIFEIGRYEVVNGVRRYAALPLGGDGVAQLSGQDPQFVVVTLFGRGCVDPASITVLDVNSTAVSIEYTIEEQEEDAAAPAQ